MTERTEHPNTEHPNTERPPTGEPKLAAFVSWLVLGASFGLSASTWIAIALLAGYTDRIDLFGLVFALAWLMPIAFDGYVVVALLLWTAPVPDRIAQFAKKNTYGAASVGVFTQSAFHCAMVAAATHSVWRAGMAAGAGMIPPGVAALAVHMRALIRRSSQQVKGRANTEQPIAPIAVEPVRPITRPIAPNTPDPIAAPIAPIAPNTPEPITPPIGPNTPDPIGPNTEQDDTDTDRENVRSITSARRRANTEANSDVAANMQSIKDRWTDWRTNMPSARAIAKHLGIAPSTGQAYRVRLLDELKTAPEQTPAADADDPEERDAV